MTLTIKSYKRLSIDIRKVIDTAIPLLLREDVPRKLHYHQHQTARGVTVYTIHVTPDDCYKASFTISEDGVAHFRRVGTHAKIDRDA